VTRDEPTHRAVVERLTAELTPVRRPWSPWIRLTLWVGLALATVGLAGVVGLRHDLSVQLARPRYLLDIAILLAGAGLAATSALLAAVPGRMGSREARAVAMGLLVLAITAALLGDAAPPPGTRSFVLTGLRCLACVGLFGLLPWVVLMRAVVRAAPLDGRTIGLSAGAAAFLVGAACVRVACPYDDTLHLAIWHGLPVALWAAASMAAGGAFLARWLAAADGDGRERLLHG
jgi:hypothetical protein